MPERLPAVDFAPAEIDGTSWKLPRKILMERPCNAAVREAYLAAGIPAAIANFLGRRLDRFLDWESLTAAKLSDIVDPGAIPSMDRAVERIVRAIREGERIVLACDHDMDGTASAAVLWTAMVDCFGVTADRIRVVTSHRLTEGYGIGDGVVARIETFGAQLVISADKGSSDEPRIAMLAAKGIDVVVTDHHVIPPEGPPQSAYAVVNPSRLDAEYDKHVCGAGVAFLVMAKVRSALLDSGVCAQLPSLASLLDFVAVATIADCVSVSPGASLMNRAFLHRGLRLVRSRCRPCWKIFAADVEGEIDAETIAFRLVPAIAASGRLDWAEVGFRFLVAKTDPEAAKCWSELKRENAERQSIERRLRAQAFPQAARVAGPAIVLFLEDGHSGVHGITASRVVEAFGKPCAIFAPQGQGARSTAPDLSQGEGLASGSFRSVPGIDVQRALKDVASAHPQLLVAYGGHQAAAGATIHVSDVNRFREAFSFAIAQQTGGAIATGPALWTDGELDADSHDLKSIQAFDALGPFGRGFEAPLYSGTFRVATYRALTNGRHGRLQLERGDLTLEAVWFSIDSALERAPAVGDTIQIAYRLNRHEFRGQVDVQATIVAGA
ncbi:MAG TPA: DHH family phosphoesterase [Acidobacteriaceae bacterium]|nr:DHH family phosphoesterase [Acidobacteriaceae bacterium]